MRLVLEARAGQQSVRGNSFEYPEKEAPGMKPIGGTLLLGIVITLVVIYALRPLHNPGAIALVGVLSIGVAALLVKGIMWTSKRRVGK